MPKTEINTEILGRVGAIFMISMAFLGFWRCGETHKVADEVAAIPVAVQVVRFDQEFDQASVETLPNLKKKYPLLFPVQYPG